MIVGYTMLHYGVDYLEYALRALEPFVDKHVIVFTDRPSWQSTALPCPDNRHMLYEIADGVLSGKLIWVEGDPQNYQTVRKHVPDADMIIETDADEIWPTALIHDVLWQYRGQALFGGTYRVPMQHFWRSFNHVCRDSSWPVRLWTSGRGYVNSTGDRMLPFGDKTPIHHFGYARDLAAMRYKIDTSMHKSEWRTGWWDSVFMRYPERLQDLHPVSVGLWNAVEYDKAGLPKIMHSHPYYERSVIE